MLPIVSNELGKIHLRVTMSLAATLGDRVSWARLGLQSLSADQSWGVEGLASAIRPRGLEG